MITIRIVKYNVNYGINPKYFIKPYTTTISHILPEDVGIHKY